MEKRKFDGFKVEFQKLDLGKIATEAIVNPTDAKFSGSGGLDLAIHKRAGWKLGLACGALGTLEEGTVKLTDGFDLPVKTIVHVSVPVYKPENIKLLEQCYLQCLRAVGIGTVMRKSVTIPLLGTGSKGWDPKLSMRCAWRAIVQSAFEGFSMVHPDKLRTIVIACDPEEHPWIKEYQTNIANWFFRLPTQWNTHGDLFFWEFLARRFAEYSGDGESAMPILRMIAKSFFEVTGTSPKPGTQIFAKKSKEELDKLSGMPIDCDFLLKVLIPLFLENYCLWRDESGKNAIETVNVILDDHEWKIPKDCCWYLESLLGEKLKIKEECTVVPAVRAGESKEKEISAVKKSEDLGNMMLNKQSMPESGNDQKRFNERVALKPAGLKYTPMVEKALMICFDAHKDQKDISGLPYIFHPFHLAEQMETEEEICVALLHDVVEDTDYTMDDLAKAGFSQDVLDAVAMMTHDLKVPYMEYIREIRKNPLARKVKMADLKHNSDLKRKAIETEWDKKRVRKYRIAMAVLEDDWYDQILQHYRKRLPLDDKRLYFLSVFYRQDGTIEKYSLDVEAASDTHIEFSARYDNVLKQKLNAKDSLPEALGEFFEQNSEHGFIKLLQQCRIKYQVFHFD